MEDFIRLYDAAPDFSIKGLSLEKKYEALGIPSTHGWTIQKVHDTLRDRIFELLNTDSEDMPHVSFSDLLQCREYWFYQDEIMCTSRFTPYIKAITQMNDSFGAKLKKLLPYTETEKWKEALRLLKCLEDERGRSGGAWTHMMQRQRDRSSAIRRLMKQGVRVVFKDETKEVDLENLFPVHQKISGVIERVGGARSTEVLLRMCANYSETHHRFTQNRQGNRLGAVKPEMDIPIAYLINLAFNKLSHKGSKRYVNELLDAIRLATDVCFAKYDAQTYTVWEDIFYNKEKIDEYFHQIIIWDSLYTIPQSSLPFVQSLMQFLIPEIHNAGYKMSGSYSLQEFDSAMGYMMGQMRSHEFIQVRLSDVQDKTGMEKEKLTAIWQDIAVQTVNAGYITPLDYAHVTISMSPGVLLPNGDILLYPQSLGAIGWYEVFVTKLREQNRGIDNMVGKLLEKYLRQQFFKKGIGTIAGDYDVKKEHGECDLAIQGEKAIVLMELKKKTLTRLSKNGHVFQIILDLAGALFYPQEQAFHTETMLLENGVLHLDDGQNKYILEKGERRIEKIAVSLNEFGALHERFIVERMLEIFCCSDISFDIDGIAEILQNVDKVKEVVKEQVKLRKKKKAMCDYAERISKIHEIKRLFFNSGFLSIEQICYILSQSSDTEDFLSKLEGMKYVTFGTKDFWAEVDLLLVTKK